MLRSRLCVPIRPVVSSCQGCSVKCPINIALSPFLCSLGLQKLTDYTHKFVGLLNLRTVSTAVQYHQARTWNGLVVGLTRAHWHNGILATPDNQGREFTQAAQDVRQGWIMHIGPPPHQTGQFSR